LALNSQKENQTYILGVGDLIDVKFFYNEKLNDEVTIRPDGKISLQLIGDVEAAGLTPPQLGSRLAGKYSKFLELPEVTVIVKDFTSQKIYVGGEVPRPKQISLKGMLRTLDAVIEAGGVLDTAKLENVVLIRQDNTRRPVVYSLDLKKVMSGEIPDVILRPYDIIYVPKTKIAKLNQFADQYIYKLLPIQKAFISLQYNLNPEVEVK
jgi:protein involved in polysaccharide export with SLBB domain